MNSPAFHVFVAVSRYSHERVLSDLSDASDDSDLSDDSDVSDHSDGFFFVCKVTI